MPFNDWHIIYTIIFISIHDYILEFLILEFTFSRIFKINNECSFVRDQSVPTKYVFFLFCEYYSKWTTDIFLQNF